MRLLEYFKYLLLLKGHYECSPAVMEVLVQEACSLEGTTLQVGKGCRLGLRRGCAAGAGRHVEMQAGCSRMGLAAGIQPATTPAAPRR
jgi:hypothetical protein